MLANTEPPLAIVTSIGSSDGRLVPRLRFPETRQTEPGPSTTTRSPPADTSSKTMAVGLATVPPLVINSWPPAPMRKKDRFVQRDPGPVTTALLLPPTNVKWTSLL